MIMSTYPRIILDFVLNVVIVVVVNVITIVIVVIVVVVGLSPVSYTHLTLPTIYSV